MRRRHLKTCLRLLLAGVLVSGGVSFSMRHAHPGGDRPHDHHHQAGAQLCEVRPHGHTHHARPAGTAPGHDHREGLYSAPLHRHVFVLGLLFTLPDERPSPDDSRDTMPAAGQTMIVRLVSSDLSDGPSQVWLKATSASAEVPLPVAAASSDRPSIRDGSMARITRPLCDTARHERSGVLLM